MIAREAIVPKALNLASRMIMAVPKAEGTIVRLPARAVETKTIIVRKAGNLASRMIMAVPKMKITIVRLRGRAMKMGTKIQVTTARKMAGPNLPRTAMGTKTRARTRTGAKTRIAPVRVVNAGIKKMITIALKAKALLNPGADTRMRTKTKGGPVRVHAVSGNILALSQWGNRAGREDSFSLGVSLPVARLSPR